MKFPSRRLLEYHRNKHFDGEGHLTEPALALHIQGLSKHNLDENLTDALAEQVKAYRETLKSGSRIAHNGEVSVISKHEPTAGRVTNQKCSLPITSVKTFSIKYRQFTTSDQVVSYICGFVQFLATRSNVYFK